MNISTSLGRSRTVTVRPVRILVTSRDRADVQAIVDQLCILRFADHKDRLSSKNHITI